MILRNQLIVVLVLLAQFACGFPKATNEKRSVHGFSHIEKLRDRREVSNSDQAPAKRDDGSYCDKFKETIKHDDKQFRDLFVHEVHLNASGKLIQLAWTGEHYEKIIALTSDEHNSTLYVSNPSGEGEMFLDRTSRLKGNLKKNVNIIKHPNDPEIIYLVSISLGSKSTLHISSDSSETFDIVNLDFIVSDSPGFIFHRKNINFIMAFDDSEKTLYLTQDKGLTWTKIASNVVSAKWSQNDDKLDEIFVITNTDVKGSLFDFLSKTNPLNNVLIKSVDFGKTWVDLKKQVHSFGVEGKFIFTSIFLSPEGDRILEVSTDNGIFWNRVRLPTVTPDTFFSILDLSNELIFLHVDDPGNTGKGVLYTSDATGIVFSESLANHFYTNFDEITDFYSVRSMPGVFISNQLLNDNGIKTMITFNRGAEWQPIKRPEGVKCEDEKLACHLQIHNTYSIQRGIEASPPLSVPNARGIIMAHGNVADSLQTSTPDVYVSTDGGHNWHFALAGPHHYQVADHGGLLVAVPSSTKTPNVIKFSANSGRCWVEYKFTEEEITFTGLLTEPSNKDSVVALWGYSAVTSIWHTFVFNFTNIIKDKCKDSDYEEWMPINHDGSSCFLGRKEKNFRVKEQSWCLTGKINPHIITTENCSCTKEDYGCDYGYAKKDGDCVRDSSVEEVINICLRNHKEAIVPLGYHKIPGDTCVGGFIPDKTNLINLNVICTDDVYLKKDSIKDEQLVQLTEQIMRSRSHKVVWTIVLIVVAVSVTMSLVWAGKKLNNKYRNVTFKYSSIRSHDTDDYFDVKVGGGDYKPINTSLYDDNSSDEDSPEQPIKSTPSVNNQVTNDALRTGFIHPKLFDLVSSDTKDKVPQKDEMLTLYDSDEELLK